MKQINLNTNFSIELSPKSLEEFKKALKKKREELPQIAERIVTRLTEEGLKDNYKSVEMLSVENNGKVVTGGIKTTDVKDTYQEFGTGIVGSNNPHIDEVLEKSGWKYDINEHGEKGWIYPKGDGTYGWTKGQLAKKKFYNAMKRMENKFPEIANEEYKK